MAWSVPVWSNLDPITAANWGLATSQDVIDDADRERLLVAEKTQRYSKAHFDATSDSSLKTSYEQAALDALKEAAEAGLVRRNAKVGMKSKGDSDLARSYAQASLKSLLETAEAGIVREDDYVDENARSGSDLATSYDQVLNALMKVAEARIVRKDNEVDESAKVSTPKAMTKVVPL